MASQRLFYLRVQFFHLKSQWQCYSSFQLATEQNSRLGTFISRCRKSVFYLVENVCWTLLLDGDFTFDCEHSTPTGLPTRTGSQAGVNSRVRFLATQTIAVSFRQKSQK